MNIEDQENIKWITLWKWIKNAFLLIGENKEGLLYQNGKINVLVLRLEKQGWTGRLFHGVQIGKITKI